MLSGVFGIVITVVAGTVPMWLLQRYFPPQKSTPFDLDDKSLARKYALWDLWLIPTTLVVAGLFGLVFYFILRGIADVHDSLLPAAEVRWTMIDIYWMLPAGFLGLMASWIPIDQFLRRQRREEFLEYLAFQSARYGYDAEGSYRFLARLVLIGCSCFTLLGLDNYVLFDGELLTINGYFTFRTHIYTANDVVSIRFAPEFVAPNGNIRDSPEYIVAFADGSGWCTNSIPSDPSFSEKMSLIRALSEKSGISIQEEELFPRRDIFPIADRIARMFERTSGED